MAVTFNISIPGESAVAVTLTTEAVQSITLFINPPISAFVQPPSTTLTAPVLVGDVTMALASVTGLTTGMGVVAGTEVSLVTAINGNTVTLTRARLGTAAGAYLAGSVVTFVRNGSYGVYIANLIGDQVRTSMTDYPGPTISTAQSTILTQRAAIATAVNAAVSHTP